MSLPLSQTDSAAIKTIIINFIFSFLEIELDQVECVRRMKRISPVINVNSV